MTFRCGLKVHFSDEKQHSRDYLIGYSQLFRTGVCRGETYSDQKTTLTTVVLRENSVEAHNTENNMKRNFCLLGISSTHSILLSDLTKSPNRRFPTGGHYRGNCCSPKTKYCLSTGRLSPPGCFLEQPCKNAACQHFNLHPLRV